MASPPQGPASRSCSRIPGLPHPQSFDGRRRLLPFRIRRNTWDVDGGDRRPASRNRRRRPVCGSVAHFGPWLPSSHPVPQSLKPFLQPCSDSEPPSVLSVSSFLPRLARMLAVARATILQNLVRYDQKTVLSPPLPFQTCSAGLVLPAS